MFSKIENLVISMGMNKPHGHYCKSCGQRKSNESFSGKGHATHICKVCSRKSPAEQSAEMTMNKLCGLPFRRLTDSEKKWLENRTHDSREDVRMLAQQIYAERFPHAERNKQKKQLHINELTFFIHASIFDEFGDEQDVNCSYAIDKKARTLIKKGFNDPMDLTALVLPGDEMNKLLRWMVHSLEVFCWEQDYCQQDSNDECDFLDNDTNIDIVQETPVEQACDLVWQITVQYSNAEKQDTRCYSPYLPDKVEELYGEMQDHFVLLDTADDF